MNNRNATKPGGVRYQINWPGGGKMGASSSWKLGGKGPSRNALGGRGSIGKKEDSEGQEAALTGARGAARELLSSYFVDPWHAGSMAAGAPGK